MPPLPLFSTLALDIAENPLGYELRLVRLVTSENGASFWQVERVLNPLLPTFSEALECANTTSTVLDLPLLDVLCGKPVSEIFG